MKTSTIILSTLIGSMTFLIVVGALQIRFTGTSKEEDTSYDYKSVDLPKGKILVLNDAHLSLKSGENTSMEIQFTEGTEAPEVSVEQKGDTVIIGWYERKQGTSYSTTMTMAPEDYHTILLNNGSIYFNNVERDSLYLILNESQIYFNPGQRSRISLMDINGSDSRIYINSGDIDQVNLDLNYCGGYINAPLELVSGSVANESNITFKDVKEFRIKRDNSSSIRHF